jgi:hypothetical protein
LTSQGTVEFRHMHGTADFEKLETWTNIVGSLIKNATEHPLAEIQEEITNLNTSSNYKSFFERTLSGLLPFEDDYRATLENGVILAKYSLLKKSGVTKKYATALDRATPPPPHMTYAEALGQLGTAGPYRPHEFNLEEAFPVRAEAVANAQTQGAATNDLMEQFLGRQRAMNSEEIRRNAFETARIQAQVNDIFPPGAPVPSEAAVQAAVRRATQREAARIESRLRRQATIAADAANVPVPTAVRPLTIFDDFN